MKETKEVIKFVLELGMAIDKSLVDKKFELSDLSNFIGAMMVIGPAINDIDKIKEEWTNVDTAKLQDLKVFVQDNFDIADDRIESVIEGAVEVGIRIFDLVKVFTKKEEAPTA